ncbi:MAG: hypothetical protein U0945_15385 [Flavobacterium sp.]|nr:hypothetical protein [Flavobacterium sp.]
MEPIYGYYIQVMEYSLEKQRTQENIFVEKDQIISFLVTAQSLLNNLKKNYFGKSIKENRTND